MAVVFAGEVGDPLDQFGIAGSQPALLEVDIVLEPGARMPAALQDPMIDLELEPADAGRPPGGARPPIAPRLDQALEPRRAPG